MGSRGLQFDPTRMSLGALSHPSQPKMLPSRKPTRGLNAIITQALTSIPLLVDYSSLLACFKLYLTTSIIHIGAHNK